MRFADAFGNLLPAVPPALSSVTVEVSVDGNAVIDGDSGCLVESGASDCVISGNHWGRCRIGLLAWDAGFVRHHDNAIVDLLEPGAASVVGP